MAHRGHVFAFIMLCFSGGDPGKFLCGHNSRECKENRTHEGQESKALQHTELLLLRGISELGEVRTTIIAGTARRSHRSCIFTSRRAAVRSLGITARAGRAARLSVKIEHCQVLSSIILRQWSGALPCWTRYSGESKRPVGLVREGSAMKLHELPEHLNREQM